MGARDYYRGYVSDHAKTDATRSDDDMAADTGGEPTSVPGETTDPGQVSGGADASASRGDAEIWARVRAQRLKEFRRITGYVIVPPLALGIVACLCATPPQQSLTKGAEFVGAAFNPDKLAAFCYAVLGAAVTLNLAMLLWDRVSGLGATEFAHLGVWRTGIIYGMRVAASASMFVAAAGWLGWPRPTEVIGQSVVMTVCALATTALVGWVNPNDALDDTGAHAAARREWQRCCLSQTTWEHKHLLEIQTKAQAPGEVAAILKRNARRTAARGAVTLLAAAAAIVALSVIVWLIFGFIPHPSFDLRLAMGIVLAWLLLWAAGITLLLFAIYAVADDIMRASFRRRWLAVPCGVGVVESLALASLVVTLRGYDGAGGRRELPVGWQWTLGVLLSAAGVGLTVAIVFWFQAAVPDAGGARWERVVRRVSRTLWGALWDSGAERTLTRMNDLDAKRNERDWPAFPAPGGGGR